MPEGLSVHFAEHHKLDISHYVLRRLANQRDSSDVTAGYIIADVERLRQTMQWIPDFILEQVECDTSEI